MRTLLLLFFVFTSSSFGQEIWEFTETCKEHEAVVKIVSPRGKMGTGVVIENKENIMTIITVAHVVDFNQDGLPIQVAYSTKHIFLGKLLYINIADDLAVIEAQGPENLKPLTLAEAIDKKDSFEAVGFGGSVDLRSWEIRHFKTKYLTFPSRAGSFSVFDSPVVPGDSGGPILNSKKEIVSLISNGKSSYNFVGLLNKAGKPVQVVWPCRGVKLSKIRKLLKDKPTIKRLKLHSNG